MAISGSEGRFIGKIGNVVYYMLNGQYVSRTIGLQPKRKSKAQLANQHAMSVTMDFVRVVNDFIKVSLAFEAKGTTKNAHNLATSYVKTEALTGEYPNMRIDYSKVILSHGDVPVPVEVGVTKAEGGVRIKWETTSDIHWTHENDSVMVLLYFPGKDRSIPMFNAGRRKDAELFIPLHKDYANEPMEVYMCFRSADGTAISDSVYLGNVNGTAMTRQEIINQQKTDKDIVHFKALEAKYLKILEETGGAMPNTKAFRVLQTEYKALKHKYRCIIDQRE